MAPNDIPIVPYCHTGSAAQAGAAGGAVDCDSTGARTGDVTAGIDPHALCAGYMYQSAGILCVAYLINTCTHVRTCTARSISAVAAVVSATQGT